MIMWELFITFFKIGLFTFGGGYAMIPLIKEEVIGHGWLTEKLILDFIGISESTPGPIAVNLATFVGSSQGGFLGAMCATIGVVLPSFIIILIIAAVFKNFSKNKYVAMIMKGIKPVILGLIITTGLFLFVQNIYVNFGDFSVAPQFEWRAAAIAAILLAFMAFVKFVCKKKLSPIVLIIIAAILGILFWL
ncbi:MAG: chromate transporter [Clostridia bacterium]